MPSGLSRGALVAKTYDTARGATVRYRVHPALTGAGGAGAGIKFTDGTVAWSAAADIIAAKAITSDFWLCGVQCYTASAAQVFEIQIRSAAGVAYADFSLDVTAVTVNVMPFMLPYPIFQSANAQVQGRVGGAGGKSIYLGIIIATAL